MLKSPPLYVICYIFLMFPSYALPYLGSNSSILNAALAAGDGRMNPVFWLHLGSLVALCTLCWVRSVHNFKAWLPAVPAVAAAFDLLPILSSIPLAPSALHAFAIVAGAGISVTEGNNDSVATPSVKVRTIIGTITALACAALFFTSSPSKTLSANKPAWANVPDRRSNNPTTNQTRPPAPSTAQPGARQNNPGPMPGSIAQDTTTTPINPKWIGIWAEASGENLQISERSAILRAGALSFNYKWLGTSNSDEPGTFAYNGTSVDRKQLQADYEKAVLRSGSSTESSAARAAVLHAFDKIKEGKHKVIIYNTGGDCPSKMWLLEEDTIVDIGNCEYGYGVKLFVRR